MSFWVFSSSVCPSSEILNVCKAETYYLLFRAKNMCANVFFQPVTPYVISSTVNNQTWMARSPENEALKIIHITATCCPLSTVACSKHNTAYLTVYLLCQQSPLLVSLCHLVCLKSVPWETLLQVLWSTHVLCQCNHIFHGYRNAFNMECACVSPGKESSTYNCMPMQPSGRHPQCLCCTLVTI